MEGRRKRRRREVRWRGEGKEEKRRWEEAGEIDKEENRGKSRRGQIQ